jgi:hypothetical protein
VSGPAEQHPLASGTPQPPLVLRARQLEVLAALKGRRQAPALYEGVLRILADDGNPARVRLAAGGLRELMDELERDAGEVPAGPRLGQRVKALDKQWAVARVRVDTADGVRAFTQTMDEFFAEYRADFKTRRETAEGTLQKLDPARREDAPPIVSGPRRNTWTDFRDKFNPVLHGSASTDEAAFRALVTAFESFLIDWLRPQPLQDVPLLEQLLKEGPPSA